MNNDDRNKEELDHVSDKERVNKLLDKHGYIPIAEGQGLDDVLLRFMSAMMDELKVEL